MSEEKTIYRISERPGDEYPYNVQEIKIIDGKEVYSGFGRFCKTEVAAQAWAGMRSHGVYTREQWEHDRDFKAVPGQAVERSIYNHMMDVVPCRTLPRALMGDGFTAGFLMGEPIDTNEDGDKLYRAFAIKEPFCYYLGLVPETRHYLFFSSNAFIDGADVTDFDSDAEARGFAIDHEAACYKQTDEGLKEIYDPKKEGAV